MLIRDGDGNYESVDYRETAPAAASEDMYKDNVHASIHGGLAAGVPGELRGLEYLHGKYGVSSSLFLITYLGRMSLISDNETHSYYLGGLL